MKKCLPIILTVSPLWLTAYTTPVVGGEINNTNGVYITEIADSKRYRAEFVELFNAGSQDVPLSGWLLEEVRSHSQSAGATTTIQLKGTIPAKGFVIVARNDSKSAFEKYFGVSLTSNVVYINSKNRLIINKTYQKFTLKKGSILVDNHEGAFLRNRKRIAVRTDFRQFNNSAFYMPRFAVKRASPGFLSKKQAAFFNAAAGNTRGKPQPASVSRVNEAVRTYYASAYEKTGQPLKAALNKIIRGHKPLSYWAVWKALKDTDEAPNNSNSVILLYKQTVQAKNSNGKRNNQWNREHVWAKSHGSFGTRNGPGTDLHHLKPANVRVNRGRGSLDFDNGGRIVWQAPLCRKDHDSYEPPDAVKGDIARMLFYMDVRYEGGDGYVDLQLVDYTGTKGPRFGKLSTLKQWHKDDPVSDFEKRRNQKIYRWQGNRNPFIDHPEWVQKIW
jgi:endonuclease I